MCCQHRRPITGRGLRAIFIQRPCVTSSTNLRCHGQSWPVHNSYCAWTSPAHTQNIPATVIWQEIPIPVASSLQLRGRRPPPKHYGGTGRPHLPVLKARHTPQIGMSSHHSASLVPHSSWPVLPRPGTHSTYSRHRPSAMQDASLRRRCSHKPRWPTQHILL